MRPPASFHQHAVDAAIGTLPGTQMGQATVRPAPGRTMAPALAGCAAPSGRHASAPLVRGAATRRASGGSGRARAPVLAISRPFGHGALALGAAVVPQAHARLFHDGLRLHGRGPLLL